MEMVSSWWFFSSVFSVLMVTYIKCTYVKVHRPGMEAMVNSPSGVGLASGLLPKRENPLPSITLHSQVAGTRCPVFAAVAVPLSSIKAGGVTDQASRALCWEN